MAPHLIYLNKTEKKALMEFKERLTEKLAGEILELKLFGSKARGNFSKDSDIDILIVLKMVNEVRKNKIYDLVLEMLRKYGVYFSVHIYSKKEYDFLNNIPTVFMQFIKREAIKI